MTEEAARTMQTDSTVEAREKRITFQIRTLFEIVNRPGRQNVLYVKDKKELK